MVRAVANLDENAFGRTTWPRHLCLYWSRTDGRQVEGNPLAAVSADDWTRSELLVLGARRPPGVRAAFAAFWLY